MILNTNPLFIFAFRFRAIYDGPILLLYCRPWRPLLRYINFFRCPPCSNRCVYTLLRHSSHYIISFSVSLIFLPSGLASGQESLCRYILGPVWILSYCAWFQVMKWWLRIICYVSLFCSRSNPCSADSNYYSTFTPLADWQDCPLYSLQKLLSESMQLWRCGGSGSAVRMRDYLDVLDSNNMI